MTRRLRSRLTALVLAGQIGLAGLGSLVGLGGHVGLARLAGLAGSAVANAAHAQDGAAGNARGAAARANPGRAVHAPTSAGRAASGRAAAALAAAPDDAMPLYVPRRGASSASLRLLGAANRGTHDESLAIAVIAPDHVGFTTQSQPTLYWFASSPIDANVELTVQAEDEIPPLVEARLPRTSRAGLQATPLAGLGAALVPGREYRWTVSVVADARNRSKDVITSGYIRRTTPDDAAAPSSAPVAVLAQDGLWYDAIAALGAQIARAPDDASLRRQRAALLRQVGLEQAAEADLSASGR